MNNALTWVRRLTAVVASLAAATLLTLVQPADASGFRDTDRDGMPNRWEIRHHLNAQKANARGDKDGDGLRNLGEYKHGTNPVDDDTDDDGLEDGDEAHDCTAATDADDADTDDDGTEDGDEDSDGDGVDNEDDDDQGEDCDDQGEDDEVERTLLGYAARH